MGRETGAYGTQNDLAGRTKLNFGVKVWWCGGVVDAPIVMGEAATCERGYAREEGMDMESS